MFEYTRQPPSTTLNCCTPYDNGFIAITLECVVRYQTNEFEIRWFRKNTTGAVEDLGLGDPDKSQGKGSMHWFSLYHEKNFNRQKYNSSYLGKYWCQVINTTADPDQPLMRSNVFTLLAPENYTQPTCASQSTVTQTMNNETCADLPVHSEQTTLPAPTTTLSSYALVNSSFSDYIGKDANTKFILLTNSLFAAINVSTTTSISFQLTQCAISNSTTQPSSLVDTHQSSFLMMAVFPTMSSSVTPNEAPIIVSVVGVCAVVLLLIVCSSLIVILIVIHQRRKKKKEAQSSSTSKNTGK